MTQTTGLRGFAMMDPERQRQLARKGGQAAHENGTAHQFSAEEARNAGRKGGQAISKNREYMAMIGKKGGRRSGASRQKKSDGLSLNGSSLPMAAESAQSAAVVQF